MWTERMDFAFSNLEKALTLSSVSVFPSIGSLFVVEANTSLVAVGGRLSQKKKRQKTSFS